MLLEAATQPIAKTWHWDELASGLANIRGKALVRQSRQACSTYSERVAASTHAAAIRSCSTPWILWST